VPIGTDIALYMSRISCNSLQKGDISCVAEQRIARSCLFQCLVIEMMGFNVKVELYPNQAIHVSPMILGGDVGI
jgi:hypothetical protein